MIISDTTLSMTYNARTIVIDGPIVKTDKMKKKQHKFKVDTIKLFWYDEQAPAIAQVFGDCVGKHRARDGRGYALDGKEPQWLKDAINA